MPGKNWEIGGEGGVGVWGYGERKVRRGGWGDPGGMGWLGWSKGGYGIREAYILIKVAILGLARDLTLEGFPGVQGDVPNPVNFIMSAYV